AALSANGMIPADQDLNAELNEGFIGGILAALGVPGNTETPDKAVTRAELAALFAQLTGQ
ncbi:MAG: hypothetical protein J6Y48_14815, partial [Clostridia bacterium]|nr:hypothetical protein [Clostridia bacterium]